MAILTGPQIIDEVSWGTIEIDPFDKKRVQPNSVDLTLGAEVKVYSKFTKMGGGGDRWTRSPSSWTSSVIYEHAPDWIGGWDGGQPTPHLDAKTKNDIYIFRMDSSGWIIKPGILYLMHTAERIHTKKFVTQLNGKSSLARLGIIVHFTAAYGETGFNGQYTLEVSAMHPVRVYPGMAICQAVFNTVYGQVEDYQARGHYIGDAAKGAEPSHSWEQFDDGV